MRLRCSERGRMAGCHETADWADAQDGIGQLHCEAGELKGCGDPQPRSGDGVMHCTRENSISEQRLCRRVVVWARLVVAVGAFWARNMIL